MTAKVQYFIKRLGRQEMGSRDRREALANRGRYILIPVSIYDLFPHLSVSQENDHAIIGLTPIFHNQSGDFQPRYYCEYVYHNSKIVCDQKNGRNERRIYLSKRLDEGLFFTGDIVILRRSWPEENVSEDLPDCEDETNPYSALKAGFEYFLDWVRQDTDEDEWSFYDELLNSNGNSSSMLYESSIDSFENKVAKVVPSNVEIDDRVIQSFRNIENSGKSEQQNPETSGSDNEAIEESNLDGLKQFAELFSPQSFRDFVMQTYGNVCAVTGEVISYGVFNNLEAAHIHPKCQGGYYLPQNGIAMRRDIHWAFDKGMFYIDPDTLEVHVHEKMKNCYLGNYEGKVIHPITPEFAPRAEFLTYHKNNIYGSFLHTGALRNVPVKAE